jgi:hypothetical protein
MIASLFLSAKKYKEMPCVEVVHFDSRLNEQQYISGYFLLCLKRIVRIDVNHTTIQSYLLRRSAVRCHVCSCEDMPLFYEFFLHIVF